MNIFLCYDRCTTCQKAEKWLNEHAIPYFKRPIKEQNPNIEELRAWTKMTTLPLRRFFNTSGLLYKQLKLKDRLPEMTEDEMLTLLSSNGMLVKRPLFLGDGFILIGFRQDEWSNALIK